MNPQKCYFNNKGGQEKSLTDINHLNSSQDTVKILNNQEQHGFKNINISSTERTEKPYNANVDNSNIMVNENEKTDIDYSDYNKMKSKIVNFNEENSKRNTIVNVIDNINKIKSNEFEDIQRFSSLKSISNNNISKINSCNERPTIVTKSYSSMNPKGSKSFVNNIDESEEKTEIKAKEKNDNKSLLMKLNDKKYNHNETQINEDQEINNNLNNKFEINLFREDYKNPISKETNNKNEDEYIIQLRNIHKSYLIGVEGVPALRGVSLKVKYGEFLVILGTSGGGKTTLLNIIGTIDAPSRGDLKIFNSNIKSYTNDNFLSLIRLNELAFVFQSFNLLNNFNVVENVELPMKIYGKLSTEEIKKRAISLLEKVGLSKRLWHFPNQLSGGEQQRVTIARALSNNPKILLLDEPTGDLDTKNSDIIMNILMDLNINEGITMIMVTHDVALKSYGNRVMRMMDGKIFSINDINKEEREINIKKLKERVNSNNLELREGVSNNNQRGNQNKTLYRKLEDYKIISNRFCKK